MWSLGVVLTCNPYKMCLEFEGMSGNTLFTRPCVLHPLKTKDHLCAFKSEDVKLASIRIISYLMIKCRATVLLLMDALFAIVMMIPLCL